MECAATLQSYVSMADLLMLVIGGQERTEEEYRALYAQADFALPHAVKHRQWGRGPHDRASKVTTRGADGVGKPKDNITVSALVKAE